MNIESSVEIKSIELMNALGQIIFVYPANQEIVEIIGEPNVYFLRIVTHKGENIIRVVKN